ncbi:hypothetical protein ACROYT_G015020 [Oculina patagonica]
MQLSRSNPQRRLIEKRTLENIQEDYDQFAADGSWVSRQKFYHNVTHCKLLDIELDKVCVPGLHISLGVFKKLFDGLEDQCFELDNRVHLQLAVGSEQLEKATVNKKMQALRAAQQHQSQVSELEEKENSLQEILNLQHEKLADDQWKLAGLEKSEGPLVKQPDTSLKEMKVERQAYRGKSFIGKHVHTCCKKNNITKLCNGIVVKPEEAALPLFLSLETVSLNVICIVFARRQHQAVLCLLFIMSCAKSASAATSLPVDPYFTDNSNNRYRKCPIYGFVESHLARQIQNKHKGEDLSLSKVARQVAVAEKKATKGNLYQCRYKGCTQVVTRMSQHLRRKHNLKDLKKITEARKKIHLAQ